MRMRTFTLVGTYHDDGQGYVELIDGTSPEEAMESWEALELAIRPIALFSGDRKDIIPEKYYAEESAS